MEKAIRAGVIGASSESIYAIEEAKKRNIYTIAVDGSADAPGLAHADSSAVVDLRDIDALYRFFEQNPVDFLLPVPVGRILIASGAVNEKLGLPGVGLHATQVSTDKWDFHQRLAEKGLRDAEARLIGSGERTDSIEDMKFPLILKPRFGSGSRAVKSYQSYAELLDDVGSIVSEDEDFIAETCVPGTEFGADVFVVDGKQHLILLREKILTPEPYRQCVGYFAVERSADRAVLFEEVERLLQGTVETLGIDNCLMHADIMFDGEKAFLIEVSPRPSGHYLHNYFTKYATGFDMLGKYIDYAIASIDGSSFDLGYDYNAEGMLIKYFDLPEGIVESIPSDDDISGLEDVVCYTCNIEKGEHIGQVTDGKSVMGRGFYVVRAESLEKGLEICNKIENQFVIKED